MRTAVIALLCCSTGLLSAQTPSPADSTGLPGDDFSLEGALDLFKQAKDLESFEQALNGTDNKVNNLDLDQNGEVDYIRVVDHAEGEAHAIVLQVPVNKSGSQDVAVIELEKKGKADAVVQIVGDEDLYGKETIVEPYDQQETDKGKKGPDAPELVTRIVVVNVWAWPCVGWIYGPSYVVWTSPWYWGYYPHWWRPWRPHPWRTWYAWERPYRAYYRSVAVNRVVVAHRAYRPHRVTSAVVVERTRAAQRSQTVAPARRDDRMDRSKATAPQRNGSRAKEAAPKPTREMRRQQKSEQRARKPQRAPRRK